MEATKQEVKPIVWKRISAIEPGESVAPDAAEEELPVVKEEFHISNEAGANWLVRKVLECRARAEKARAWAEQEEATAKRHEDFFLGRYGGELRTWLEQEISNGKSKSVHLPGGTVGLRTNPARLTVVDEEKTLAWAKAHLPAAVELVPAVEKLSRKELIQAFSAGRTAGEIPDGAEMMPAEERLYVK